VYRRQSAPVPLSPQRAFGRRIRELRLAAGMTQDDLAERIETGKANPTLTMIHALAVSLDVKPATLFKAPAKSTPVRAAPASARPSRGRVSR